MGFARIALIPSSVVWLGACSLPNDVISQLSSDAAGGGAPNTELPAPTSPIEPTSDPDCSERCGRLECPCQNGSISITAANGTRYRIDLTEVTIAQYAVFLEHGRPLTPRDPTEDAGASSLFEHQCAWNQTHTPAVTSYDMDVRCRTDFDFERFLAESPQRPIVCVDWCDARDYCLWNGGYLCGVIGGGSLDASSAHTNEDAWYSACSANGSRIYAYGNTYDPNACNTQESGNNGVSIPVASMPNCEGPVAGLFDMNGNADEWVDYCDPEHPRGQTEAQCFRVGGAFFQRGRELSRCDATLSGRRSTVGNDTGIRCCYDD